MDIFPNFRMLGNQIIKNQTYIDVEVPTKIGSKLWNNPDKFYEIIWKDVVKMGLVKGKMPKNKKFIKFHDSKYSRFYVIT